MSENGSTLAAALVAFQADAPHITKDAINPHFKNRYASLDSIMDAVRAPLAAHGLAISQHPTVYDGGHPALCTILLHSSGERLEDVMLLAADKPGPQAQGSALTYARRYAVLAVLGLVADEDDDANSAEASGPAQPSSPPERSREGGAGKSKGSDLQPHQKALYKLFKQKEDAGQIDAAGFKQMIADIRASSLGHVDAAQAGDITKWLNALADDGIPF